MIGGSKPAYLRTQRQGVNSRNTSMDSGCCPHSGASFNLLQLASSINHHKGKQAISLTTPYKVGWKDGGRNNLKIGTSQTLLSSESPWGLLVKSPSSLSESVTSLQVTQLLPVWKPHLRTTGLERPLRQCHKLHSMNFIAILYQLKKNEWEN